MNTKEERLREIVSQAVALAKQAPAEMRSVAFTKVFDALVGDLAIHASKDVTTAPSATAGGRTRDLGSLDRTAHPAIETIGGTLERSLYILLVAHRELDIDWLTAAEISKVLQEKFRQSHTTNAVQKALNRAGRYVDRREFADGTKYRLMAPGEKHVASLTGPGNGNHTPRPPSGKAMRSKPAIVSSEREDNTKPQASVVNKRPAKRGSGATAIVDELVTSGFFASEARSLTNVADELAHKKARRLKLKELSVVMMRMVRAGKLVRELAADGVYLYRAAPSSDADPYFDELVQRTRESARS
jgi:hypothetical protein